MLSRIQLKQEKHDAVLLLNRQVIVIQNSDIKGGRLPVCISVCSAVRRNALET